MKTGDGKRGRPINFDKGAALEAAMLLFWEPGFEGTSMADLTQAWPSVPQASMRLSATSGLCFALAAKRYLFSSRTIGDTRLERRDAHSRTEAALNARTLAVGAGVKPGGIGSFVLDGFLPHARKECGSHVSALRDQPPDLLSWGRRARPSSMAPSNAPRAPIGRSSTK
jgi:hypothetical protein